MIIKVWDVLTGNNIKSLKGHYNRVNSVCFSANDSNIISGSNRTLKIWDFESGNNIKTLSDYSQAVLCICLSSDDKKIITGS
jgi:WD40 repeat protein